MVWLVGDGLYGAATDSTFNGVAGWFSGYFALIEYSGGSH